MTLSWSLSLAAVALWLGLAIGAKLWRRPPRSAVYRFSTGQEVAAPYFFEWLALLKPDEWPPTGEVLDAARSVGSGLTAVEIEKLTTGIRPMALRAAERGRRAMH